MGLDLFDFQIRGSKWLAERNVALLADEMGVGKSAQLVHACDLVNAKRILIVCPAVGRENWTREFRLFSPNFRAFQVVLDGKSPISAAHSIIISYDLAIKVKIPCEFDVLILDEVHMCKSLDALRAKRIFGKEGLVRQSKRVWAASGTPAPNHPGELWILLYSFGATNLKYDAFVETYCKTYPSNFGIKICGAKPDMIKDLKKKLNSVMLRRKKEDVMSELPPIMYSDLVVEPGEVDLDIESSFIQYVYPVDRTQFLFNKMREERALLEGVVGATGLGKDGLMGLNALAKSVSTLRRYTGLQKVKPIIELVTQELTDKAYEKVVIFAIHRDVIEGLRVGLRKFRPVTLYGGTAPNTRQSNIDKFQNNRLTRVFIGNIQAAGTSITLTSAHHVVFLEVDWVPGNNAQAAMRCHRIGQTKPVSVRFIGLSDSIDERITQVLKRKTKELTAIFDEEKELQDFKTTATENI